LDKTWTFFLPKKERIGSSADVQRVFSRCGNPHFFPKLRVFRIDYNNIPSPEGCKCIVPAVRAFICVAFLNYFPAAPACFSFLHILTFLFLFFLRPSVRRLLYLLLFLRLRLFPELELLINLLPLPARFAGMIVTWRTALFSIATLIVIGVAAATYPARRASELEPVEALRFEM